MRIRILQAAMEDLDRGRNFYDRLGDGLGTYFLDSLFSEIDSLVLYRGLHPRLFGYHRLLAKRFPYAVYYRIEADDLVLVFRVLDLRQAPGRIRRALP